MATEVKNLNMRSVTLLGLIKKQPEEGKHKGRSSISLTKEEVVT